MHTPRSSRDAIGGSQLRALVINVFEIYSGLWSMAEQIGPKPKPTAVRSVWVNEQCTDNGSSFFTPTGTGGRPELRIHNPDRIAPTSRPIDDAHVLTKLITLGHECGHAVMGHERGRCLGRVLRGKQPPHRCARPTGAGAVRKRERDRNVDARRSRCSNRRAHA